MYDEMKLMFDRRGLVSTNVEHINTVVSSCWPVGPDLYKRSSSLQARTASF